MIELFYTWFTTVTFYFLSLYFDTVEGYEFEPYMSSLSIIDPVPQWIQLRYQHCMIVHCTHGNLNRKPFLYKVFYLGWTVRTETKYNGRE